LKVHEYQGKEIFRQFGVVVPEGYPAFSIDEAVANYRKLPGDLAVVKAQIHAGGRGKGGGVKLAHNEKEVRDLARNMLGMQLVTHQTGPAGKQVQRLLVEAGVRIARELYAGIVLDRSTGEFVFMVSTEGGIEIEKVAQENPDKIIKEWINPGLGLRGYQARKLAFALGLEGAQVKSAIKIFQSLWQVFYNKDCSLIEINPLVVTEDDQVIALDAKINFDDNGLFRHSEIKELRDITEEDPAEAEATKFSLNYIKLDGNVGCMVNGAGLAMATMDIIKLNGGEPANFLDVGGVANSKTVANGFRLILSDPNVKSVLINIFGGIVRCDRVAAGIIEALSEIDVKIPVIIRLEGTNAQEAARLLKESSLQFKVAKSLQDGAEQAVKAAAGGAK